MSQRIQLGRNKRAKYDNVHNELEDRLPRIRKLRRIISALRQSLLCTTSDSSSSFSPSVSAIDPAPGGLPLDEEHPKITLALNISSDEEDIKILENKNDETDEFHACGGHNYDEELQHISPITQDHMNTDSEISGSEDLDSLWNEMSLAMDCTKKATSSEEYAILQGEGKCNHLFVLKDDMGIVCQVCGIIQESIEQIFDYQWTKRLRTMRTYAPGLQNRKNGTSALHSELKSPEKHIAAAEIVIHPKHGKRMKSHQLEGFNFLVRNLLADEPGGCILAHAPGSGKTFMIISFIQSIFGKEPDAKPLIVLPKGILSTWKEEFQKWQVENIPLYDLYSEKATNRSQQLEVLNKWCNSKSILLMGYQLLSSIICDDAEGDIENACKKILLKKPNLLILDEGHTPRNDESNLLHSLASIRTPRKVVLSGTLYQNHVKEVFNILDLVRPKFLKMESSQDVMRRIKNHVQISSSKRLYRTNGKSVLFELIERTLQSDDSSRKAMVIKDLRDMTRNVLHYYKGDFLEELPGFVDTTVFLNLTSKQRDTVKMLEKIDNKFQRSCLCSSVSIHPLLNNTLEGKPCNIKERDMDNVIDKLDINEGVTLNIFMNILSLSDAVGEKVLVFSQYLLPLRFLERFLARKKGWRSGKEIFMISGESSSEKRESSMEQFNNSSDSKVLFGSIKACGEGISLVGASRVIILDVHLNPSVSRQAIGRAFRPGQTRKVHVYRLVAADSPEERDHKTSFKKELTSKMWFEWSDGFGAQEFTMKETDVQDCEDSFLENPHFVQHVKALYRRCL